MKTMRELKNILNLATAELGEDHEQVVMLRSLLEARLNEHGLSIANKSTVTSGPVRVVNES